MSSLPYLLLFTLIPCTLSAWDIYVAPQGNDAASGSIHQPLASLSAARDRVRASGRLGKEPVVIHLAPGTYFLKQPLVLESQDGGSAQYPVIWRSTLEGGAILSGGIDLGSNWKREKEDLWSLATPKNLLMDGLEIEGQQKILARFPNHNLNDQATPYRGAAESSVIHARAKGWSDPSGGYIHALHASLWGGYHFKILGKNSNGDLRTEGGWQNNRGGPPHAKFQMAEGIREELDAPGEWYHDRQAGKLLIQGEAGAKPGRAIASVLTELVVIRGQPGKPVQHLHLEGLNFRHTARTFMQSREPLLRSDWTFHRGGAVLIEGATDITLSNCDLQGLGGNAVVVSGYARKITLRGLLFKDIGATAVAFVGHPSAVRNPLYHYNQRLKLEQLDRTPGPRGEDYPADCLLEDSLIQRVGLVEKQAAGVQVAMAQRITLRHLTIHETSRAGINFGDGTWGGHIIEGCDVFDTVLETGDHGSFNSWGRDRYWGAASDADVAREPTLPFLDAQEPVIIRYSRWRCDHGWDVDLDDGSSNYEIHHNLFLRGGLKLREGWRRKAWNNIFINCGLHPHVWHQGSGDVFERNILLDRHAPIGMPRDWGKAIDRNLYTRADDLAYGRSLGVDANSITADPKFVDPTKGDFRVQPDSPALALGFENFPMDQFGVRKASLRALAGQPLIEQPRLMRALEDTLTPYFWRGIPLAALKGEAFSAYGVARDSRGVILGPIPGGHPMLRLAPQGHLLATHVNGVGVGTPEEFLTQIKKGLSALTIVRSDAQTPTSFKSADAALIPSEVSSQSSPNLESLKLKPGQMPKHEVKWEARPAPANGPAAQLGDGQLKPEYGPVFANNVKGFYRADLGQAKEVVAVRTWSFRESPSRLPQTFAVLGSDGAEPGWDTTNYRWLGEVRIQPESVDWLATELRVRGRVRWLLFIPESPVTEENTVFQEIEVGP